MVVFFSFLCFLLFLLAIANTVIIFIKLVQRKSTKNTIKIIVICIVLSFICGMISGLLYEPQDKNIEKNKIVSEEKEDNLKGVSNENKKLDDNNIIEEEEIINNNKKEDNMEEISDEYKNLDDNIIENKEEIRNNETENKSSVSKNKSDLDSKLSKIDVYYKDNYVEEDELILKVFVKNNTNEIFKGNVKVTFYREDKNKRLGSDIVLVDELYPGREIWANVKIDKYSGNKKMVVDFSSEEFIPVKEIVSEVNEEVTEKTKESYYWNFDGVTWYDDIKDIVVYKDGICVITLKKGYKNEAQSYAASIWACSSDYGVKTVRAVDENGNVLSIFER